MDKPKLNFRFHNPNSEENFVRLLISVCMETCRVKADEAISADLLNKKEETAATDADKKSTHMIINGARKTALLRKRNPICAQAPRWVNL